jgi:hypothetical protein
MIDRRRAFGFALAALAATVLLPSSAAHAQQSFQRFIPFLIDLDGWKGNKAEGLSLEMPNNSLITATRKYERGPAHLDAQITTGPAAQGALAMTRTGIKLETSDGRMNTSTIDGMPVTTSFNIKDKSGTIIVALGTAAMFNMSYRGIADDEALALARKFNWKAIQAALPK